MNPFNPKTCGFACPEENKCLVHGYDLSKTAKIYNCDICHKPTLDIIVEPSMHKLICFDCYSKLSTCFGCKHGQYCAFEQDPSPIPKITVQTIRQGNMVGQIQIKNPERIKICCTGCPCYKNDKCERDNLYCSAYNFIYDQEEKCDDKIFEAK